MPRVEVRTEGRGRVDATLLTEHVPAELLADHHYAAQLVERLRWALVDAEQEEQAIHP
jgi:hypothetical protein